MDNVDGQAFDIKVSGISFQKGTEVACFIFQFYFLPNPRPQKPRNLPETALNHVFPSPEGTAIG